MSDKRAYKMKNLLSINCEAAGLVGHKALSLRGANYVNECMSFSRKSKQIDDGTQTFTTQVGLPTLAELAFPAF